LLITEVEGVDVSAHEVEVKAHCVGRAPLYNHSNSRLNTFIAASLTEIKNRYGQKNHCHYSFSPQISAIQYSRIKLYNPRDKGVIEDRQYCEDEKGSC
jgi:hypothetical protein